MPQRRTLLAEVDEEVRRSLDAASFRRRREGLYTVETAPHVLGWLGLNTSYFGKGAVLEINPVIGVRHQSVERLVADLQGVEFHPYLPCSVSSPLGYLMPASEFLVWAFQRGVDVGPPAADMARAVLTYGLQFMRETLTLPQLLRRIEDNQGNQLEYRLPVVLMLLGQKERAASAIDAHLARIGSQDNPYTVAYRSFARNVRGRLGLSPQERPLPGGGSTSEQQKPDS